MTLRPRSRFRAKHRPAARADNFAELIGRHANGGTAAEMAYAVLREAVLSNILAPGVRLRADAIAKKLGVSKTPVREALRKLEAEDLVVSAGNALTVKVLSEQQLLEIYYTREALEGPEPVVLLLQDLQEPVARCLCVGAALGLVVD